MQRLRAAAGVGQRGTHVSHRRPTPPLHHPPVSPYPPTLQLPWAPLLREEEWARGIVHYGGGARMRQVAAKLAAGRPIKSATLGGSITFGHGVSDPQLHAFPSLFFRFINTTWPHR